MARPEVTGRKINRAGKSISEFCRAYDIGRATFYNWKKLGLAPAVVQPAGPGGWQIITEEAEQAWKARHTECWRAEREAETATAESSV